MILLLILSLIAICGAILALELDDKLWAVLALWISTVTCGLIFLTLGAWFAGLFELIVYGGCLIILFTIYSSLAEKKTQEQVKNSSEEGR